MDKIDNKSQNISYGIFLPYGKQMIDEDDIKSIVNILKNDRLTTGPVVRQFEDEIANHCGSKHAIALSNGTAALHVAMLAAKIGIGDRILTSPNTFIASANCVAYVSAIPDFVDIDELSLNISTEALINQWTNDVRGVVAVDFAGYPCDIIRISEIAKEKGAVVIEDACHAIGGEIYYKNKWHKIGGHPWADMTVFSFHPVKTITTGEGGAILTNDDNLAERCRMLRNHGMVKRSKMVIESAQGINEKIPWPNEMVELGFNYRITDIQCALGISQLNKLNKFIKRRQEIVNHYNNAFSILNHVKTPPISSHYRPSWHLYVLQIDFKSIGITRIEMIKQLEELGIGTQVHYFPVYLQTYYRNKYGYGPGKCPVAESVYEKSLSLPLYPSLSDTDVARVIDAVTKIIGS